MNPNAAASLAAEDFVLLTTYRRTGEAVATPVWIADLDGRLVVSTPDGTGKLKRLRHTSTVALQACSRRGTPKEGAPVVPGHAEVSRDPNVRTRTEAALASKYGLQWRAITLIERVVRRGKVVPRPVVLIDLG